MTPARHAAIKAAFERAREATGAEQDAILAELGPDLRREVERLLAAAGAPRCDAEGTVPPGFVDPTGRWRALEVIGEGGMGVVYRGERADGEYRREVAIKSLAGAGTRLLVARSRRERALLARLDHPNIARLIDGGRDARGVPFLVMELIDGEPIDRWCERTNADAATRIRLVATVAEAVAHAHRQLVVHRDLKPSNILIDRAGDPKLLDFGISAPLDAGSTALTAEGVAPMTLAYASPERLRGETAGIAADVYALGVILYELLSGELPYRAPRDRSAELIRAIVEGARPRRLAAIRRHPGGRRLGAEIDDILAMALAPEPERRYSGADRFAADLRALLDGRAVSARPPTLGYRARIAWRRQWPLWSGIGLLLALSGAYALTLSRQIEEVARERDRARASADFLVHLFDTVEPRRLVTGEASARELLDQGFATLERGGLASIEARNRPDLYQILGAVFHRLKLHDEAERAFERAIALRRSESPIDQRALAMHLNALATVRRLRGDIEGAARLIDEALAARRAASDTRSPEYANLLNSHAILLDQLGRHDEARRTFERALERYRQLGPSGAEGYGNTLNNYGTQLRRLGDLDGCIETQRQALRVLRSVLRDDHPRFVDLYGDLGVCLAASGRIDEAEAAFRTAIELGERVVAADDPTLARVRGDSALVHRARGDLESARRALEHALAVLLPRFGAEHELVAGFKAELSALEREAPQLPDGTAIPHATANEAMHPPPR